MKFTLKTLLVLPTLALTLASCSSDDDSPSHTNNNTQKTETISNYANIVYSNYQDALTDAQSLKTTITNFVNDPTDANFTASKTAWKTARESYGTTEAFRFANGPIDFGSTEDIEGYLNAWPLDENYIDYVDGVSNSGIVNDTSIILTKASLIALNNGTGEMGSDPGKNVAIGYHAIEFLLWGQDLTAPSTLQAGQRPYTDFVDDGTAANQDRRRQYLAICADLLIDHLQIMIDEWKTDGNYRATFLALDANEALTNMFSSIAELSKAELAGERMFVAYDNQDQEDEHSCFSDNTHRDIRLNLAGIANVYRGSYGAINGTSLEDLITEENATLGTEISILLATAETALDNTAVPFDFAISDASERPKVLTAISSLQAFSDKLVDGAAALGITVNF